FQTALGLGLILVLVQVLLHMSVKAYISKMALASLFTSVGVSQRRANSMPDFRSIIKGSVYLAVGSQLGRAISFVQVVLLTKYLGSAGYGVWSLVQAIPSI